MDFPILWQYDIKILILQQYNMRMSVLAIYYSYWDVSPGVKLPLASSGQALPDTNDGILGIFIG
jgi:hypothetical protein